MSKVDNKKTSPFSLRLSSDEKLFLQKQAGDQPLSTYIRSKILDQPEPRRKQFKRHQNPIKDRRELAQIFGLLGQSEIAINLNEIVQAIKTNSLIVTEETETSLLKACEMIELILKHLAKALGIKEP